MNRFVQTTILLFSISSLIGCASLEVPYEPPGHACGFDPVFGSCHTCGVCGGDCEGHTPASYIGHQLRCTSGCGEIYWGPWHNDPPDRCDPCDDCGNWVGDRCCAPKLRDRIKSALTAYDGPPKYGKGCGACGGKGCSSCGPVGNCKGCGGKGYGGKGCTSCGSSISEVPYYESGESIILPNEAPTPELIPSTPPPIAPEVERPASIRPAQSISFRLPFQIRSARLAE